MQVRPGLRWVVARAAYPSIVVSSPGLALALSARGVSPAATTSLVFVLVLALVWILERVLPHTRGAGAAPSEARQDLAYLGLASALQFVGRAGGQLVALLIALALAPLTGVHAAFAAVPPWLRVLAAVALADVAKYGLHRLAHEHPWWWRFHAEHHAPARMYSLNGVRLHPVNLLWNLVPDAAAPVLLGLEPRAVVLVAVLRGTVAVLQHADVDLRLGPLNAVFSTPELHRWHHSVALDEANANYGSTFIVWDLLFGTRRRPRDRVAPRALGLAGHPPHPVGLWHQLVWPWCAPRRERCRSVRGWRDRYAAVAATASFGAPAREGVGAAIVPR